MNSKNKDLGQAIPSAAALGRQIHQRMATFGVLDMLDEVIEFQTRNMVVELNSLVECTSEIYRLVEHVKGTIEDSGRRELEIVDALASKPPVWKLDAALNENRVRVLEGFAKSESWRFGWARGDFIASAPDFSLHVYSSDAWRCSSGMPDVQIAGVGLTALLAHLRGEDLNMTVAFLAPIFLKGGAK